MTGAPLAVEVPVVPVLDRSTTAQRVADLLRDRVLRGELPTGAQVAEQDLSAALGISRNTLREAFQILIGERLLVREPHRGVFVRRMGVDDVHDVYAFRRLVECAALAHPVDRTGLTAMHAAVGLGRGAAARQDWRGVGTADVHFHLGITALAGSARLDRAVRAVFAELRLAFQLVPDPRRLHEPFLDRNAEIVDLTDAGSTSAAADALRRYLDDAEAVIVAALPGT